MTFTAKLTPAGWDPTIIAPPGTDVAAVVQAAVTERLSDMSPMPETNSTGKAGTTTNIPKADHQHPPVRSATIVTIGSNGTAIVTYTRKFDSPPCFVPGVVNPSGRPVQVEVIRDILDTDGKYVGAEIRAYRSQLLPALSGIALLTGLITALSNFDALGGSAAGVQVRFSAFPQTV